MSRFERICRYVLYALCALGGVWLLWTRRDFEYGFGLIGVSALIASIDVFARPVLKLERDNPKLKSVLRLDAFILLGFAVISLYTPWREAFISEEPVFLTLMAAVLMAVIGNTAPKIPRNWFVGVRLPWTVFNERAWRIAHRWLGYLAFPIIALMLLAVFLFKYDFAPVVALGIWVLVPTIASAVVFVQQMLKTRSLKEK